MQQEPSRGVEKKKTGRPTDYSPEMSAKICGYVAEGISFRKMIQMDDTLPDMRTIFYWLRLHDEFNQQYAKAKEQGSEAWADEIMDIADDGTNDWMEVQKARGGTRIILDREHVERSKLRIDSRKWLLSKLKAKKYGDKIDHTTNGKDLPVPILGYVQRNDGDKKGGGDAQADPGGAGGDVRVEDDLDSLIPDR